MDFGGDICIGILFLSAMKGINGISEHPGLPSWSTTLQPIVGQEITVHPLHH
jgi:hypothetical protein